MRRFNPFRVIGWLVVGLLWGPIGAGCDDQGAENYRQNKPDLHPPRQTTSSSADPSPSLGPPVRIGQFHMGMMIYLTVYGEDTDAARLACRKAFQRIRQINLIMSDYEPNSELSKLCRKAGQGPVPVSEELFAILARARKLAEQTDGLYDPTAGPVIRLWRKARKDKQLPSAEALTDALSRTGYRKMKLDADRRTVELTVPGMQLDLGAIGKGYAGDLAIAVLKAEGFPRAMYEAGGDMVFGGAPPNTDGWPVELPLQPPRTERLADCAISISGDTVQFIIIDGKRYSHVVDPRTGLGLTDRAMCIVIAKQGGLSDPLATIGTLLSGKDYEQLLDQYKNTVIQHWRFVATRSDNGVEHRIPPPLQ